MYIRKFMPAGYVQEHNRPAKQPTIKRIAAQNQIRVKCALVFYVRLDLNNKFLPDGINT